MKKQRLIILMAFLTFFVLLATACAGATPEPTATPIPPTATPVPPTATPEPTPTPSPNASPAGVMDAVFAAARTADFESLANLCDSAEKNDKDTQMICDLATDPEFRDRFVEYFSQGKITGDTQISDDGNSAEVPVLLGPDGDKEELMKLIKRDGKWYLSSF